MTRLIARRKVPLSDKQKVKILTAALLVLHQEHGFREPNSDHHEYCKGCHRSPYNEPPHAPGCPVVLIMNTLQRVGVKL